MMAKLEDVAPTGLACSADLCPTACAVGYRTSPLRGLGRLQEFRLTPMRRWPGFVSSPLRGWKGLLHHRYSAAWWKMGANISLRQAASDTMSRRGFGWEATSIAPFATIRKVANTSLAGDGMPIHDVCPAHLRECRVGGRWVAVGLAALLLIAGLSRLRASPPQNQQHSSGKNRSSKMTKEERRRQKALQVEMTNPYWGWLHEEVPYIIAAEGARSLQATDHR